ncbi:hypothetical protein CDL12_27037 [Handroanthus impetiginosus]|uniref:Uncharacterized protein n=1 Tax=Handroanthus impetiginosus TaxID=429701 RepID=A0A2G9G561_9LAMI|nr:hypothetical protein CDL12_27037 [Handroanthus impetiginosus]
MPFYSSVIIHARLYFNYHSRLVLLVVKKAGFTGGVFHEWRAFQSNVPFLPFPPIRQSQTMGLLAHLY